MSRVIRCCEISDDLGIVRKILCSLYFSSKYSSFSLINTASECLYLHAKINAL